MTTLEPGARLLLTHGLRSRPNCRAFFAKSPAPIMTLGLLVFVQLVMAAITTAPCFRMNSWPSIITAAPSSASAVAVGSVVALEPALSLGSAPCQVFCMAGRSTRSCGRLGPAKHGTIVDWSSSTTAPYEIGRLSSRQRPCALA